MADNSKLISHTSIYFFGNILRRLVSFIMLPIYTRFLSPADYGVIELLNLSVDLAGLIFGLRIAQAIFRHYSHYEGKEKDEVVTTALYLVAGASSVGIVLLVAFSKSITTLTFGDPELAGLLSMFSLTLLGQGLIEVPMTGVKAAQRPILYVAFSLAQLLLQLSLNIYFVVLLEMRVEGVIYSSLISTTVMALALCSYTFYCRGMKFSRFKARELVTFSVPLVMTDFLSFYITFGDRYFLRIYYGVDEVGIYTLAYKFGFLLAFLVVVPFGNIWDTEKYNIIKSPDYRKKFSDVFIYYNLALISLALFISIFIRDFITIMSAPEFHEAHRFVPIILFAYVVNAWASFANLGIYLKKKTSEMFYGTVLAAFVITAGYLLLIPKFGGFGAAWATFFAFSARTLWVYFRSNRLLNMGLKWGNVITMFGVWILAIFLTFFSPEALLLSILYNCGLLLLVVFAFIALPVIPAEHKLKIRQTMCAKINNMR